MPKQYKKNADGLSLAYLGLTEMMPRLRVRRNLINLTAGVLLLYFGMQLTAMVFYSGISKPSDDQTTNSKNQYGQCDKIVPVTMVIMRAADSRGAARLVKSILFYTRATISLTFLGTDTTCQTIDKLFSTWELPNVYSRCFTVPDLLKTDSRASSSALGIGWYINQNLYKPSKILYLGPDMRFADDIQPFWESMKNTLSQDKPIGMTLMPLLNKGSVTNPDLVVLDLRVLLGHVDKEALLNRIFSPQNAVEEDTVVLPCHWAPSLTKETNLSECLGTSVIRSYKEGPLLYSFNKHTEVENVRRQHNMLSVFNGDLLRNPTGKCVVYKPSQNQYEKDPKRECAEFLIEGANKRRTHLFYVAPPKQPPGGQYDVTIATQLTLDRFSVFEKFLDSWSGPLSAAFHVNEEDALALEETVKKSKTMNKHQNNVTIHVVYKRGPYYPINYLRNVAVSTVSTPFTLFVDVDLVPRPNMFQHLKKHVTGNMDKVALVVPSFEALEQLDELPVNKAEMLEHLAKDRISGYSMKRGWNHGHKPTNFEYWKIANESYEVTGGGAFEPYVILKTADLPQYDERLLERFGDKIIYGYLLWGLGYTFKVLPDSYVLHLPHPVSNGTLTWKSSPRYKRCGGLVHGDIKKEIDELREEKLKVK